MHWLFHKLGQVTTEAAHPMTKEDWMTLCSKPMGKLSNCVRL